MAVSQLKGHCNSNKRWAFDLLSNYLLTKPNGTAAEREEGQAIYATMIERWGE